MVGGPPGRARARARRLDGRRAHRAAAADLAPRARDQRRQLVELPRRPRRLHEQRRAAPARQRDAHDRVDGQPARAVQPALARADRAGAPRRGPALWRPAGPRLPGALGGRRRARPRRRPARRRHRRRPRRLGGRAALGGDAHAAAVAPRRRQRRRLPASRRPRRRRAERGAPRVGAERGGGAARLQCTHAAAAGHVLLGAADLAARRSERSV